jgi:DNA-binding protein HU-beta
MNKNELVREIAKTADITLVASEAALNALVSTITQVLANKDKLTLIGFGSFEVAERPARVGRNPSTGETIQIQASVVPKFKPGKTLKDAVARPEVKKAKAVKTEVSKNPAKKTAKK